jgi:SAM-dependent methyltransferase
MRNMIEHQSNSSLVGVNADVAAGVTIGTVFSGYFNSNVPAQAFAEVGIGPLLPDLGDEIAFADFGGGDGFLAAYVRDYLLSHERRVKGVVIDMNPSYLEGSQRRGFTTIAASLDQVEAGPFDLIVARAILHYNPFETQKAIIENVCKNLKPGGYFVHSPSTGEVHNCALRTAIAALPSLGRTNGDGSVHFIVPETYLELTGQAGFTETRLAGFAPNNAWTLTEMFTRFNPLPAIEDTAYLARKWQFMQDALALIEKYRQETSIQGITLLDGEAQIEYQYPVFVSRAPQA